MRRFSCRPSARLSRFALLVLALSIGACTANPKPSPSPPVAPSEPSWDELRPPLQLPVYAAGDACEVAPASAVGGVTSALGEGPVRPWGTGLIRLSEFEPDPSGDYRVKVLWLIDPAQHSGPVLVRGERLDDGTPLLFATASESDPEGELRLAGNPDHSGGSGWWEFGSYTIISRAGCYAYQINGLGIQDTVVFQVTD